jgi:hypothetical protein
MYRPLADDAEVERRIVGAIRRAQWQVDAVRVELALKNLDRVWRKAGFNPGQPRVPAGSPDGGQWIAAGGSAEGLGFDDPRILSDATPDNEWTPNAQYASNRPPLGQFPGATPAQQARFAAASVRADSAIRRVRQVDPTWEPRIASLSVPNSIEGAIGHAEARALAAETKLRELEPTARQLAPSVSRKQRDAGSLRYWSMGPRKKHCCRGNAGGTAFLWRKFERAHLYQP